MLQKIFQQDRQSRKENRGFNSYHSNKNWESINIPTPSWIPALHRLQVVHKITSVTELYKGGRKGNSYITISIPAVFTNTLIFLYFNIWNLFLIMSTNSSHCNNDHSHKVNNASETSNSSTTLTRAKDLLASNFQ